MLRFLRGLATSLLLAHSSFVQNNASLLEEARANRLEMTNIAVVQQLLIHSQAELGSDNLAALIMQQPERMQTFYLSLLAKAAKLEEAGDSGSESDDDDSGAKCEVNVPGVRDGDAVESLLVGATADHHPGMPSLCKMLESGC